MADWPALQAYGRRNPPGEIIHSYTMLTVTYDHEFARAHRPEDEKRMVVILPKGLYRDWAR